MSTDYSADTKYLKEKYEVNLINNPDYLTRNNNGSIWRARHVICNSYICSADNYFSRNPFEKEVDMAYYSAVYSKGFTDEWCMTEKDGLIDSVTIGGCDAWYMLGHVFWDEGFSSKFLTILDKVYALPETADKLWESIFIDHIHELPMKIRKYPAGVIYEFDTLDELRKFDTSYVDNTRSEIIKSICQKLSVKENMITDISAYKGSNTAAAGFTFKCNQRAFRFDYAAKNLEKVN